MSVKVVDFCDLFSFDDSYAVVNAVNCVGVMGKGLALNFKRRYADTRMFAVYRNACLAHRLVPGVLLVQTFDGYPTVIQFPTKVDWRNPSQLKYIDAGLAKLATSYMQAGLTKVVMPAIGCGLGGLAFDDVENLVHHYFDDSSLEVVLIRQK